MDHSNCRTELLFLQIAVKPAELPDKEHSLVDNRPAGQAHHIGVVIGLFKLPAHNIEPSVERKTGRHIIRTAQKTLQDGRHAVSRCSAEDFRVDRHLPPAEKTDAFFLCNDFKHFLSLTAGKIFPGEKEHSDSVISLIRQKDVLLFCRFLKKGMADL